jgi:hypothetical protein
MRLHRRAFIGDILKTGVAISAAGATKWLS